MRNYLLKSKDLLQLKQVDLFDLWSKSIQYKEMLRVFDIIDDLKRAPQKIDSLMQNKYYLAATKKLLESLKTINGRECTSITALDEIRKQLDSLKDTLYEAIIEEMHNHLYLKSPYTEDRWTALLPAQQDQILLLSSDAAHQRSQFPIAGSIANLTQGRMSTAASSAKHRHRKSDSGVDESTLFEDMDSNPELDSLYYIRILLESLMLLGQLPDGLKLIIQRLPLEIFHLVERAIAEFEERASNMVFNGSTTRGGFWGTAKVVDTHSISDASKEPQLEALREFITVLYAKFETIIEGHRFVENAVRGLGKRGLFVQSGNDPALLPVYTVADVWMSIQQEMKSLLLDYLRETERSNRPSISVNEILKSQQQMKERNKTTTPRQSYFRFVDSDCTPNITKFYNNLNIQSGIASSTQSSNQLNNNVTADILTKSAVIDQFADVGSFQGHKTIVPPGPANVNVMFIPTLKLVDKIEQSLIDFSTTSPTYDAFQDKENEFHAFLDDFVLNVFVPQIEEKVLSYVHRYIAGPEAFVVDTENSMMTARPLLKSAPSLISLIQSLCATLRKVPFHRDEYIRMIENTMMKYLEKCYSKYKGIITADVNVFNSDNSLYETLSGQWAQNEDLTRLLRDNTFFTNKPPDVELNDKLSVREIIFESKLSKDRSIHRSEMIFDRKKLQLLGHLRFSIQWFIAEIQKLRLNTIDDDGNPTKSNNGKIMDRGGSLSSIVSTQQGATGGDEPRAGDEAELNAVVLLENDSDVLPLSGEMVIRFDRLIDQFNKLSEICLFTLRLELRIHCMYYLDLAMREGSYFLDDEAFEPDPYVVMLNDDLIAFEESVVNSAPANEARFVFYGLPLLMTHSLVANVRYIKALNRNGITKMVRNISALQQNLTNIGLSEETRLDHAQRYYELYYLEGDGIIRSILDHGPSYTYEEYIAMFEFVFNVNALEGDKHHDDPSISGAAMRTEKQYLNCCRRLKELLGRRDA
ncbi:hypothetical protein BKA69DRAFT_1076112 [Paraphysoderma sedebokerense]|nr:hypothetical protein BKA69DRAFT_1076112 [Paraphysoderma sedebokerense]